MSIPSSLVSLIKHSIKCELIAGVIGGDREIFKDVFLLKGSDHFNRVKVIFVIKLLSTFEVDILNILLREVIINPLSLNYIRRDLKLKLIKAFVVVFILYNMILRMLNLMSIIIVFS